MDDHAKFDKKLDAIDAHFRASSAMKAAVKVFLELSQADHRYDRTHKKMVRILKDWNRIEETRERPVPPHDHKSQGLMVTPDGSIVPVLEDES